MNKEDLRNAIAGFANIGQFGINLVVPPVLLGMLASWLRNKFGLGAWITFLLLFIGLMTSVSTAVNFARDAAKKNEKEGRKDKGVYFNDHI